MRKALTLLLFVLLFNFIQTKAQSLDWAWARSGGSVSIEYSNASCTDASGNVYITGTFQGSTVIFGNDTLHNNATGSLAVFIVKYDPNGNVLWARSGGGIGSDYTYGICTDANDSGSASITFDTITLNNSVNEEVFIVKYDSIGNVQWGKNGKGSAGYGWGICSDAEGNVYFYGNAGTNNIIFDNDTLGKGTFIVKYDRGGNVIWAKKVATGLNANSREQSMCIDVSGNIYITGTTYGTAIFENDTIAAYLSVFLAKYDSNGSKLWVKNAYGAGIGNAIAADANGNIYMTGYFGGLVAFGNDTLTGLPFSNSTIFVAKYDSSGNALWGRSPGGSGFDYGQSICTDSSGNVFVTGYFTSSFLNFGGHPVININTGYDDIFVAEYDANGNTLWAKGVGGSDNEYGMGICSSPSGDIYVTGYYGSYSLNFGSTTVTNNGSYDIFLAKLSPLVGINELFSNNGMFIYPNPATSTLNIQSTNPLSTITIYSTDGRIVKSLVIGHSSLVNIDVKDLSAGVYFLDCEGEKGREMVKVVKY
jgi:hypothetical protein